MSRAAARKDMPLLDHIAEDLAREYVRLMERAAQEDGTEHPPRKEA